jgi:hypothetical protein
VKNNILGLLLLAFPMHTAWAGVTGLKILQQSEVLEGRSFGSAGPYERIVAKADFAIDPRAEPNRIIADANLAPRDQSGKVEFSADVYIIRPRDPAKGNGTALVQISNRGGKGLLSTFDFAKPSLDPRTPDQFGDRFLLEQGFTLVWVGWEFDVPDKPNLLRVNIPIATDHGKTITGMVISEWTGRKRVATIALADPNYKAYAAADENDPADELLVRNSYWGALEKIPRKEWGFADATHVTLASGFEPDKLYDVVYSAKDPVVAGLGLAAVRDLVSYLKYGGPQAPLVKRAIGFGISQSGRFLREFLYDGFNEDEEHRRVFDGVWAHVAGAGRGSFNVRFAQPSRDVRAFLDVFSPADIPPFADRALLAREAQSGTIPKLFLSNGSSEYWIRCASLIHTTPDGEADVDPMPSTRIYFFAGAQHSMGTMPPRKIAARNLGSINDYRCALRALLIDMQAWIKDGEPPPPSRMPKLSKAQLVPLSKLDFPAIPGVQAPKHKREAYRLDFSAVPPKLGPAFPTFVPQVNSDGNELGGIDMPEIQMPLGTSTGWNLPAPLAAGDQFALSGSWIPFAKTKAERESSHDSRRSITERYRNKTAYLGEIGAAAEHLVQERLLLPRDVLRLRERASAEWDYATANFSLAQR